MLSQFFSTLDLTSPVIMNGPRGLNFMDRGRRAVHSHCRSANGNGERGRVLSGLGLRDYSITQGGCQAVAGGKQAISTGEQATDGAGKGGMVPPPETRWKPGQSGNPKGRPKGAATSFERVLEQELDRQVDGDLTLGDDGRISRRRRLVRALLAAVERGDPWAVRLAFERVWPEPKADGQGPDIRFVYLDDQDRFA